MRKRLTVNERGELVTREGEVLGKVVSMTLDLPFGERGTIGGEGATSGDSESLQVEPSEGGAGGSDESEPEQGMLVPDPIEEVWEHYRQRVPDGQKQRTTTRTAEIRKALKVRDLDACKRAIDGLAASDWHHGKNEQRSTYLELEYALGKLKWERDRCADKIDEMGKRAAKVAERPLGGAVPVAELTAKYQGYSKDLVLGKMGDVRKALFEPSELNLRLATEAEAWLREQCGIVVKWRDGNRIGWGRA